MTFGSPQPTAARPPQRSRARKFIPLAIAAWAVLEIWLLILVGEAAGGLTVLALLAAGVVLGSVVIKRAGRRAWERLARTVQAAENPAAAPAEQRESSGNGLMMLGGLLIMIPGLVSDAAGLLCLFPPTRSLLRKAFERRLSRRVGSPAPGTLGDAFQQARMHRPDGKVVPGEVIRDDEPPTPRHDGPQLPH
ncbi:FxsA family membrane protein [Streptomyces sp. NPDC050610]|uniref:FxsA family membrane protein n=1 Tax=Streptomyces sp. NPDC050610 TaxID=3157097 RepID=UPI00341B6422